MSGTETAYRASSCNGMPGTDLGYGAITLRACCALSGTDRAYGGTDRAYGACWCCSTDLAYGASSCYGMCGADPGYEQHGTDLGYGAMSSM
eukprot:241032-Rhodomonas_salina.1